MTESMHPYSYSCPLSYLEMAPVECEAWHEQVRSYHEAGRRRRELSRKARHG